MRATAPPEIYTLSLHDALPIFDPFSSWMFFFTTSRPTPRPEISLTAASASTWRSEEHTSELQSHSDLVCRLLLEKKKIHSIPIQLLSLLYRNLNTVTSSNCTKK